jgi:hypothetical protein
MTALARWCTRFRERETPLGYSLHALDVVHRWLFTEL